MILVPTVQLIYHLTDHGIDVTLVIFTDHVPSPKTIHSRDTLLRLDVLLDKENLETPDLDYTLTTQKENHY